MTTATKSPKNYENHRENQRERILEAAKKLFIQNGINNVSMGDIAKTARMARITVYEYYQNKEDIAWAIFQRTVEYFKMDFSALSSASAMNAYQLMEKIIQELIDNWDALSIHFRFIFEINTLYVRGNNPNSMRQTVEQSWAGVYDSTMQLIRAGIADGSLRPDLDPGLVAAAFSNQINAVSSWFALLGNQIAQEYQQPQMGIYQEIFRNFLRGIKA